MISMNYVRELIRVRAKTLLLLLVLLAANVCLFLYHDLYQTPRLESLQKEWFAKRKNSGNVLNKGTAFEQGSKDLATWRAMIAPKKDLARIVGELYETARTNSLVIGGITYKPEEIKAEKLLVYQIALTVNGKYAALKSFIADLARIRDIVTIDDISLSNPKLTEEMISLKMNLTIYLRMEGQ